MTNRVWSNLDKILATAGLILSALMILFVAVTIGRYVEVPLVLFIACASYLRARRRPPVSDGALLSFAESRSSVRLMLDILFFVLFFLSLLSLAQHQDLYSRPLTYFIATACMAAILATRILLTPPESTSNYRVLFQLIILGLSLRITPQLLFPNVIGIDPWFHQTLTNGIIELGNIPQDTSYSNLAIMHLIIGISSMIFDADYVVSTMLTLTVVQTIAFAMFAFLLGRYYINAKIGLMAAWILMLAPGVLGHGLSVTPTALSMIWILMIIYVISPVKEKKSLRLSGILVLLIITLVLTHTVSAACMAIILLCFWAGSAIYSRMHERISGASPTAYLFTSILFVVSMLGWWMYASGHITFLSDLINWGFKIDSWAPSSATVDYMSQIAYSEYLLNQVGFLFFYALAIPGLLYMVSPVFRSGHRFCIALSGGVLTGIAFSVLILGLTGALADRWFYYSQLVMAIPAGLGLIIYSTFAQNKLKRTLLLGAMSFAISFMMITSAMTDFDSPIYAKNLTPRIALTESEMQGMDTISTIWRGEVAVIYPDAYYFMYKKRMFIREMETALGSQDFGDYKFTMPIIREEIVHHPFSTHTGILQIDYVPQELLLKEGFAHIYDSETVSAFLFTRYSRARV